MSTTCLSDAGLDRYLQITQQHATPAVLQVRADHPAATVFVDGRPAGMAPLAVEVQPGWHRVTLERPGRRTAWVGEVVPSPRQRLEIRAELDQDDSPAVLEAQVIGVIHGTSAPPEVARQLADWGQAQGLSRVRFVDLSPPRAFGQAPEERIHARLDLWDLNSAWLDVSSARFLSRGPGLVALREDADPERFTMGVQIGYRRLQQNLPTGPDPHDHLDLELVGLVKLSPSLAVDARVGLWQAAQPYYLYRDWLASQVVPLSLGLRWSSGQGGIVHGGPYLGGHALAVVPLAVGGDAFLGWLWKPTPRWRLSVELNGGWTDRGPLGGASLGVGFAG
ncbi:MAG: PEGA domain-containing protein [Oligoflexia bacterium]|nr:PEGA domain-containing protein [Oligoflexia bacterium]